MADVTNLAQVTEGGISCATFPEIKDALARKMQEIYGYDIDLSTASADGQYVMMEALVLNNIYRTLESLVNNLSLANASGKYLDILSSLSGVFRRQATYSTAKVYVDTTALGDSTVEPDSLEFLDRNGNYWFWLNPLNINGSKTITFKGSTVLGEVVVTALTLTCEDLGPINAIGGDLLSTGLSLKSIFTKQDNNNQYYYKKGDINSCISNSSFKVYQDENAIVGQSVESDAELRSRRLKSLGQSGSTVLENMQARLMSVAGVVDAIVYSNNTRELMTIYGISIQPNTVFPVVCVQNSITGIDNFIGEVIYDTITPGIGTIGENKYTVEISNGVSNTVSWKQTTSAHPWLEIDLIPTDQENVSSVSDEQCNAIGSALKSYFNSLRMDSTIYGSVLVQIISGADFRTGLYGNQTYSVKAIKYNNDKTFLFDQNNTTGSLNLNLTKLTYTQEDTVSVSRFAAGHPDTGGVATVKMQFGDGTWPTIS